MVSSLLAASLLLAALRRGGPPPTPRDGQLVDRRVDGGSTRPGSYSTEWPPISPVACTPSWALPDVNGNNPTCQALTTDYLPGGTDTWAPCISDGDMNKYVPFNTSISSIARVAAFESMMTRLLTAQPPSATDFVDAKVDYTQPEGLDSRVSIREDEHYPPAAKKCADMSAAELAQNADRCVGGARMQPLLNQAFVDGAAGKEPLLNAARIESTLLWFLYLSVYKEANTCTTKAQDCDSSYAYYTGGEDRGGGQGLAGYVRASAARPTTGSSTASWRCAAGAISTRPPRRPTSACATRPPPSSIEACSAAWRCLPGAASRRSRPPAASLGRRSGPRSRILGGALDREARARDAARAQTLRTELARASVDSADLELLDTTLEELFPCP